MWEDVLLLPQDPAYDGEAVQLTVDAFGDVGDPTHGGERAEFQKKALQKLGDRECWIESSDMIVRATDFNKQELIQWVHRWFSETGLPQIELATAPIEEFKGRYPYADLLITLQKKL